LEDFALGRPASDRACSEAGAIRRLSTIAQASRIGAIGLEQIAAVELLGLGVFVGIERWKLG
jgi:hypothetical protein